MRKHATVALAVFAIVGAAVLLSRTGHDPAPPSPPASPVTIPTGTVADNALTVSDAVLPGYNRDLFGPAWADVDHNGCNQREDTIMRDTGAARTTRKGVCRADMTGHPYRDPYTGTTLTAPADIQIDHVVSLADAWRSGAAGWTPEQRKAYANDLGVLLAVQAKANEDKSDKGPDEWLPPDPADRCAFAQQYVAIKIKYRLTVTSSAHRALDTLAAMCGS